MDPSPTNVYKISKKPMSDYYKIKPKTDNSQEYAVNIESHDSTDSPFMFLHEGSSIKDAKAVVGSVRRNPEEAAFEISSNSLQDVDNRRCVGKLKRTLGMTAEMQVGVSDGGEPRALAWRPIMGQGLSCSLVDMSSPGTALAKYEEGSFGRGELTINVDWGLDFEKAVITSAICMFEKTSAWSKAHGEQAAQFSAPPGKGPGIVGFYGGYAGAGGDV